MPIGVIESLDHEGRGVTRADGKTVFVEGALPAERVEYSSYRRKPSYELASLARVLARSSQRVEPVCPHFGTCGGCSMQHLEAAAQAATKQRVLEDVLWHLARLRPGQVYPAISGACRGYRHRARLSVRLVPKKGGVLVGFHERRSSYVADMRSCDVLPPHVGRLLPELKTLVGSLSIADRLPQIEVAVGDEVTVLVLRILQRLTRIDEQLIRDFAGRHGVHVYLQTGGPDSAAPFFPERPAELWYALPEFDVRIDFSPTHFTQVNPFVNRMLVRRAMALLDPRPGERVSDMFCGLGNFSLPIARCGAQVVGVEGSPALVAAAQANARRNGLEGSAEFSLANLFETDEQTLSALGRLDKMLIDPPREGAIALVKALGRDAPRRIVYVSCNPATLARDAAVLVHDKGYRLRGVGIANMFPHTSHVESVALLERA
ncbi:MAG: 23S rRNA (uracil(1939)-C(5))-methyltransferase RlmD [Betaproteobacteria bacterium]|nr:23S rRNA (uracil(1939)-C(5))-methyltransferase RlmD [Betaproteobacteria bacterium]